MHNNSNDKLLQNLRVEVSGGSSYEDPSRYVSINGDGQQLAEMFVQRNGKQTICVGVF